MNEKLKIAVFVDYDNIEIGVKSTLQRDFDVGSVLDALKERGDIVAKFAYADWGRQEGAKRQMAENAVQMVQRIPSPRGDKNGADINLALDALEMAFTHDHVNAFAIVSGDSDFIPLLNKLKEFGKTVFVVGGKAFTSTILQKNCHEFISFEALLDEPQRQPQHPQPPPQPQQQPQQSRPPREERPHGPEPRGGRPYQHDRQRPPRHRPAPLELGRAMPLVERALQVLERREVTPQLGLLKSTMLQLDSTFTEKAYGAGSFSEFVEKLKAAGYVNVSGGEGRYVIERKTKPEEKALQPDEALPLLRDVLETHRLELDSGALPDDLVGWIREVRPEFDCTRYGFQEFTEFLNYAQDKLLVRVEPDEERGLLVYLGAEFYPPAPPPEPEAPPQVEDEKQPESNESAPLVLPAPAKRKRAPRKKTAEGVQGQRPPRTYQRRSRRKQSQ